MLAGLGSPCCAPVGALAEVVEDLEEDEAGVAVITESLSLRGVAATPDGALVRASVLGKTTEAESLGRALAAELLDLGATPPPRSAGNHTSDTAGAGDNAAGPAAGGTTHRSIGST